jgi:hypothetical protein
MCACRVPIRTLWTPPTPSYKLRTHLVPVRPRAPQRILHSMPTSTGQFLIGTLDNVAVERHLVIVVVIVCICARYVELGVRFRRRHAW